MALVVLVAMSAFAETKDRKISAILPEVVGSWDEVLDEFLRRWDCDYWSSGEYQTITHDFNFEHGIVFWKRPGYARSIFRVIMEISKSPKLSRVAYNWSLPIIKKRFRGLSKDEKKTVLAEIKFVRNYSKNFDYDKEAERIRQNPVELGERWDEWHKAFIFRRFRDGLNHKIAYKYSAKLFRELRKL